MSTSYHVYSNGGTGGPVDYSTVVATTASLSWATPALTAGTWTFAVRAFDTVSGLEESNVDATVTIVVSAGLADVTAVPAAPRGLTAAATAGGTAHVAWSYPLSAPTPTGFHVYNGTPTPDYTTPAATVPATAARAYAANLAGLAEGTAYQIGVRAYNAVGEESNAVVVPVVGSGVAPANVTNLVAS